MTVSTRRRVILKIIQVFEFKCIPNLKKKKKPCSHLLQVSITQVCDRVAIISIIITISMSQLDFVV